MIKTNTENAIINAAFDVLGRNASASLNDIAEAAGVGRATLHRYFPGRGDLLTALSERATTEMDLAIEEATQGARSYIQALELAMAALIPLADRQLFLAQSTNRIEADRLPSEKRDLAETRAAIERAKAEGTLPAHVSSDWMARTYEGLIYTAWEAVSAQELTPNQAAKLAWSTFFFGIKGASL